MPDDELLDIVDEQDKIIALDTKDNKLSKGLISRNVAIFIVDSNNNLIITKRSPAKKTFPNRYDVAACGNVIAGESCNDAAKRELKEELGIDCPLELIEKIFNEFQHNGKTLRYFTSVFKGRLSGSITLNSELTEFHAMSISHIQKLIGKDRDLFTPGFVNDFIRLKDRLIT